MNKRRKAGGLDKLPTGIAGFDRITGGGLPARRTTLLAGGAGSGKTVFALQTLANGARRGQPAIFVSFNQHPRQVVENAAPFGWDIETLEKDKLAFLDARLRPTVVRAGQYDLTGMLAGLRVVAGELGARRLVFDSFDVLLTLLDDRLAELHETLRLRDWLCENEFAALITVSLDASDPRAAQRYACVQSIADCCVTLDYRTDGRTALRALRLLKYRGSRFMEQEFPFSITDSGIEVPLPPARSAAGVTAAAGLNPEIEEARRELTARLQALDHFLEMKKAELDFLTRKETPPAETPQLDSPLQPRCDGSVPLRSGSS
ncbi:MAG: ATPase domain-containing protein [Limisphaerales bacterium]